MDTTKEMTAHQRLLLEMLKDFDAVCRKHNIRYQLFAGTALGAVRHNGFIPWDDDVDVILMRCEYERFFEEAAADFDPKIYYVQGEHSAHWPMQFSKLRRNNTACIEKYHPRDKNIHQGVYIDIFPCDNLSDNPIVRRLQFTASKVVIAKALYARGYETNSIVNGIELEYDKYLKGNDGGILYYSDGKGNRLNLSEVYDEPVNGNNISLTIDINIQEAVEKELDNVVTKYNPDSTLALVMDPNSGEVLAMSSRPNFDSNNYKNYNLETINRNLPIWMTYEPGSTFKNVNTI